MQYCSGHADAFDLRKWDSQARAVAYRTTNFRFPNRVSQVRILLGALTSCLVRFLFLVNPVYLVQLACN